MIASWGYGSGLIYRLQQHRNQLFALREMIDLFLGEIQYGKSPLKEACQQIGQQMGQPFQEVLKEIAKDLSNNHYESFQKIWQQQFDLRKKEFYFSGQEMDLLYGLGKYLGYLDVEAQIRHLKLYQTQVDERLEQQQQTMKDKKKVYRSVSLMVGVMVVLLFI